MFKDYKILFFIATISLLSTSVITAQTIVKAPNLLTDHYSSHAYEPLWTGPVFPGNAQIILNKGQFGLKNQVIESTWSITKKQLQLAQVKDLAGKQSLDFNGVSTFLFEMVSSGKLSAGDFIMIKGPEFINLNPNKKSACISDHIPGKAIEVTLFNKKSGMVINWMAELRDGSNYIRQIYTIKRQKQGNADTATRIVLLRLPVPYLPLNSIGTVPGSPYAIPATAFIASIEQPGYLAIAAIDNPNITELSIPSQLAFGHGDQYQISTMIGVFPLQQRRRTFQYYIERERVAGYHNYLHYNSWYDLGEDLSEDKLIRVAKSYNEELTKKRNIKLDGFVLDDGWDNPDSALWKPDKIRFPDGFSRIQKFLDSGSGTKLGLWISPYGGYGGRVKRLELAKKEGIIPSDAKDFDLGYPGYYKFFKSLCLYYMKTYNVNYFKWDHAAPFENSGLTFGNLKFTSYFMRLCQLSVGLHKEKPDLFINATVGTWPSPFWLLFVDCTWRMGGPDVSWIGKGNNRERGMNYRDGEVYKMVVERAPLYPLSSMMFHGVVLGHKFQAKKTSEAGNNMTNEFRSYFALGANLQELYLSPDMMGTKAWDDLASCIRWNRKHAALLVDSHWVQGDPNKSQPYCYASWRNNEGAICIRNPDEVDRSITIDIAKAFELPSGATQNYQLVAAYADQRIQKLVAKGGIPLTITLKPFEVLVFDALPNGVEIQKTSLTQLGSNTKMAWDTLLNTVYGKRGGIVTFRELPICARSALKVNGASPNINLKKFNYLSVAQYKYICWKQL